ncbi:MAG: FtsQ-type POTRA domain-containing protein [Chloroflexia bacterium]|nr:FtsQ-type POTRA domain-containing protein [Chloroflexia bacterium]
MNAERRHPVNDSPPPSRRRRGVRPGSRIMLIGFVQSGRIISLGLVLVVVYYCMQIFWSGMYVVHTVNVAGAVTMSSQRVSELAAVKGKSIWSVDTNAIRARLLANPYVTSAAVQIQLPDVVSITITEQKSEIRWKSGQWYYIVNSDGELLGNDLTVVLTDTIVINDDSGKRRKAGDKVDSAVIALARDMALRLPADAGVTIARLGWDPRRGMHVLTSTHEFVLFGTSNRLDEKIAILKQLRVNKVEFGFADLRPLTAYYRVDVPLSEVLTDTATLSETKILSDTSQITATNVLTTTAP